MCFGFDRTTQHAFFKNISLVLEQGAFYLLTGVNGAGKSTFFRVLTGNLAPSEFLTGVVRMGDRSISLQNPAEHRLLQQQCMLVPQTFDHVVVSSLTVRENLQVARLKRYPSLSLMSSMSEAEMFASYNKLPLDSVVSTLSGGQRQVLSLCMMMQKEATILLFDEPTAALDQQQALHVASVFREQALAHNKIILASCHDARLIAVHNPAHVFCIEVNDSGSRSMKSMKNDDTM